MENSPNQYHRHRFPPEIIAHTVWFYHRFTLSLRDIDELLAERGVIVSYESIRRWCAKFGPEYASLVKKRMGLRSDVWHMDEVLIKIQGIPHYLWRAVDQDGDTLDILIRKTKEQESRTEVLQKTVERAGLFT